MNRHERVLVALSCTEHDDAVIAYAKMLAGFDIGRLFYFVHVSDGHHAAAEKSDSQLLHECQDRVTKHFGGPRENVVSSCELLSGPRVDQLIDFVTQQRCDLTLLGHRKSRTGQRSLARRMAMIAPCSVWMVPEGAPLSISKVMAPIDFSDHAADSLEATAWIARAAGLNECTALHVYFDTSTIRYDEHVQEVRQHEQQQYDQFIAPVQSHGIELRPQFVEGAKVGGTILYYAQQDGTDLIVMNTRGRSRAASILLGSVTSQVMIESKIAILAVKHYGAMMNLFQSLQSGQVWHRQNPKTN